MVTEFVEGETYHNKNVEQDIMVYAVAHETDVDVTLAVGFVDRVSEEMTSTGELTIKKSDYKDWEQVEIE